MKVYKVGVIPGDGTGPEVVREGVKVLDAVSRVNDFKFEFVNYDVGAKRYLKTKELMPDSVLKELVQMDSNLLGAIGDQTVVAPGILEQGINLYMRRALNLYINLRPVKLYPGVECIIKGKEPKDIDFDVVRENTEGLYVNCGGTYREGTPDEVAIQESINTRKGVEQCIRYSFELARQRDRKRKVTLCAKTNVLTYASGLWERVFNEVAKDYPDIKTDYAHVDAICMWMVKNPEWFDVIVTDNLFGDIISDLGAMIQGGLGIAAGGNINPKGTAVFESIGGSAPKYTGKNVINPLATIGSCRLMMDFLGEKKAARQIEAAIIQVLTKNIKDLSAGKMGCSTSEVGDLVANYVVTA
jgi:3-isopropylmalate dehydrogenase